VATLASVPQNVTDPVQTLPMYTKLFMELGVVAVGGTLIAIALLPLMKRLSTTHSAQGDDVDAFVPAAARTVGAET
jgi:POT family proton-dependent oligopeptide transporter